VSVLLVYFHCGIAERARSVLPGEFEVLCAAHHGLLAEMAWEAALACAEQGSRLGMKHEPVGCREH